jgi:hypothetical protein
LFFRKEGFISENTHFQKGEGVPFWGTFPGRKLHEQLENVIAKRFAPNLIVQEENRCKLFLVPGTPNG